MEIKLKKWMHFYCFRAVKNYKNVFQLMHAIKIKYFNNYLYFYCIDNGINFSIVVVNLSRVPPIIVKGQNYAKFPEKLWDKIKQTEECEKATSSKNR